MRFLTYIGILLSFSLALTACAGAAGPVVSSGDRYTATNDEIEDYRLGVGDKVRLTVFNEETLSGEFAVSANGTLSLPLIGDVTATGKGVEDITKLVEARLADGYVRDPKVNIEITTYRPFFILGEVRQPGQYPYAAGMTVTNAIALAQGYTPRAVQGSVFIRSAGGATEKGYRLTPDLRVRPGDTIRINERYF